MSENLKQQIAIFIRRVAENEVIRFIERKSIIPDHARHNTLDFNQPTMPLPHTMLLFTWIALMLTALPEAAAQTPSRPNVLLICVDDLKPTIGCFGDPIAKTPNIDALARRGVRFQSAYCNQAVCSPSRNALMTGLRPQSIGIYDLATHFRKSVPDVTTFSQYFIEHGYSAEGLGKIYHVGHGNIDDKRSWSKPSWRPRTPSYVLESSRNNIVADKQGRMRGPATEAADVPDETYADGAIAEEAIKRLKSLSDAKQQPFFLAVGFVKPHLPFVAPQRYWDLYDADALPMPKTHEPPKEAPSYAPTNFGELRNYSDMPGKGSIDEATTRRLIHGYYAATSYMDAQLGRVIAQADSLGLLDNTIVVLWGDHGWHLGDHGMWCKHTNYEQAARIPVVVVAPNGDHGKASDALIETVDIFPTVAQLAGLPIPQQIDGRSFANVVKNPMAEARPYATHVYPRGERIGRAIRDGRYRMIEWKVPGKPSASAEIELYDYQEDPNETLNQAGRQPDVVKAMRERLNEHPEAKKQYRATAVSRTR
ncbi:MAG: sulfatase [Pirellulaceae bacterium]